MSLTFRLGLAFSVELDYCRRAMLGVKRFADGRPDWLLMPVAADPAAVRSLRRFRPQGLVAFLHGRAVARAAAGLGVPVVNVCGVLPDAGFPRVGIDDRRVGELAADHLLGRGLTRFAYLGQADHAGSVRREAAYRARVGASGHHSSAYVDRLGRFDPKGGLLAMDRGFHRWLAGLPKPVGLFAHYDYWAVQATEACRHLGLRVPDDVAIVGMDDDDLLCELSRPSLSSVAVPSERIGYEAASLLDRLLGGAEPPSEPVLLPPTHVVSRQSSDLASSDDADVADALRYIRRAAHGPIDVTDVLKAVPTSRRSLERRFRRVVGRGLGEEIRRVRLDRARELLVTTDLPMPEVARVSGYSSAARFSVAFRRSSGETPTGFRRRHHA